MQKNLTIDPTGTTKLKNTTRKTKGARKLCGRYAKFLPAACVFLSNSKSTFLGKEMDSMLHG